ncbi:hypothetical protein Tco_0539394 [Tanacetum coccineum]
MTQAHEDMYRGGSTTVSVEVVVCGVVSGVVSSVVYGVVSDVVSSVVSVVSKVISRTGSVITGGKIGGGSWAPSSKWSIFISSDYVKLCELARTE